MGATYYMSCVNLEAGSTFSHALGKNMVRSQIAHFRLKKKKSYVSFSLLGTQSPSVRMDLWVSSLCLNTNPQFFPTVNITFHTPKQEPPLPTFKIGFLPPHDNAGLVNSIHAGHTATGPHTGLLKGVAGTRGEAASGSWSPACPSSLACVQ